MVRITEQKEGHKDPALIKSRDSRKGSTAYFSFHSKLGKTPYSRVLSLCHLEGVSDAMKGTDPLSDADRRIIEDLKLRIELKQLEVTRFFKFENNFLFRTKSSRKQD